LNNFQNIALSGMIRKDAIRGITAIGIALLALSCTTNRSPKKAIGLPLGVTVPLHNTISGSKGYNVGRGSYKYSVKGRSYHVMSRQEAATYSETGMASWYGAEGSSRTSTGERYNSYAMTGAHRTLPLGSTVRVTNLSNGNSVNLRINDRGPFSKGRLIDTSKGAAQKLGFTSKGVIPVRVEVLN
jgi:rare lipoprotein A (peptidoglycan hydrolase)